MKTYIVTASAPKNPQYGEWEFRIAAATKAKAIATARPKAKDEIGRMFGPISYRAEVAE